MTKKAIKKPAPQEVVRSNSLNAPIVHKKCNLIVVRETLGISQPAMAVKMRLSPSGLWKIEQGTAVKLNVARKIALFYGKSIDELWPMDSQEDAISASVKSATKPKGGPRHESHGKKKAVEPGLQKSKKI